MVFRKSMGRSRVFSQQLQLERLESRRLLAGDVVAFLAGGNLKVEGDSEDNAIRISATEGVLAVAATDGDTVIKEAYSGTGSSVVEFDLADLTGSILVRMRNGNDSVVVGGEDTDDHSHVVAANGKPDDGHEDDHEEEPSFTIPRDLTINAGKGDNGVRVSFTHVGRHLTVKAYGGEDTVDIGRGRGYGAEDHDDDGGCGDHTEPVVGIMAAEDESGGCEDEDGGPPADVAVGGRLRVETNGGNDGVKVSFTEVGGDLKLYTGQGEDLVAVGRGPMFTRDDPGGHDGGDHHEPLFAVLSDDDCADDCGEDTDHDTDHGDGGPPPDTRVGASLGVYTAGQDDKIKVAFAGVARELTISGGTGADYVVTGRGPIVGHHGSGSGGAGGHKPTLALAVESDSEHSGGRPVDLRVGGGMVLTGSDGDDFIMMRNTRVGATLRATTQTGDDSVGIQNLKVERSAIISVGQGSNIVAVLDSYFADTLSINSTYNSSGQDLVAFDSVHVTGRLRVSTGAGADQLIMQDSIFDGAVVANMGPGDDTLAARRNDFSSSVNFNGSAGAADALFLAAGAEQNTFDSPPLTPHFEILLEEFDFDEVWAEVEDEFVGFLQGKL